MDNTDMKLQRGMLLQGLLEASGFKELKKDLNDCVLYADSEIDSCKKGYVQDAKVAKLNYDLGRRNGLEMVLNILQGYEDELVGDNVKSQK